MYKNSVFHAFIDHHNQKDIKISDYYCAYTPYKFAFVLLILQWIFIPIMICCSCLLLSGACVAACCAVCCCGDASSSSQGTTYAATATSDPSASEA